MHYYTITIQYYNIIILYYTILHLHTTYIHYRYPSMYAQYTIALLHYHEWSPVALVLHEVGQKGDRLDRLAQALA